jgi:hypothetical protein
VQRYRHGDHAGYRRRRPGEIRRDAAREQKRAAAQPDAGADRQPGHGRHDEPAPPDGAGRSGPAGANGARREHLHAQQQGDAAQEGGAVDRPPQGLVRQLVGRDLADHDGIDDAHAADAEPAQRHRQSEAQQAADPR